MTLGNKNQSQLALKVHMYTLHNLSRRQQAGSVREHQLSRLLWTGSGCLHLMRFASSRIRTKPSRLR